MIKSIESDFPEQFKHRNNTYKICTALDRQINEFANAVEQILSLTNINVATGTQLDRIGEIVGLTRAEAGLLCGQSIYFDVVDDDRYRKYLKYKAFRNSNDCTYYSLINAMKEILGSSTVIEYSEDEGYPATIILDIQPASGETLNLGDIPPIKPAGVKVEYKVDELTTIEISHDIRFYFGGIACGTHYCGTYPPKS